MKKIILTLAGLFAVSMASAQSYPKQPDKTVVEYVNYQKPAETPDENADEAKSKNKGNDYGKDKLPEQGNGKIEKNAAPAVLNNNKKGVAANETNP